MCNSAQRVYVAVMATDEHVSIREAAEILGCSRSSVQRLVDTGELPAGRIGSVAIIRRVDLKGVVVRSYESKADFEARRAAAREAAAS